MNSYSTERILIVEDDPIICEPLRATLEYCGYTCDTASTAAVALDQLKRTSPDAIIADLGLPDCDGVELISTMRRSSNIPIIVVSGRSTEADKVAALDRGADDYVQKPYLPGELIARIRAKLRQARNDGLEEPERLYEISPDTEVGLSRMERALLALLVQHQGATVSEDQIITTLWGSNSRATSADLRTLVLKLRRKLGEQWQPLYVLNERGVGYYVSGFGRFPRQARGAAQLALESAQVTSHSEQDNAVDPARSAVFSHKAADLGSKDRAS